MTAVNSSPLRLLVLLLISTNIGAFQPASPSFTLSNTQLFMAKKKGKRSGKSKGFGDAPAPKKQSAKSTSSESFTPIATTPEPKPMQGTPALPNTQNTQLESPRTADRPGTNEMNQGQIALQQMRREQAEKKDIELRRVREIRDTDRMLQDSREAAAIPEKVAMRMGKRMLPFVGIPLFGSLAAFVAFWYFATYKDLEFEPGMVAASTIVILVSGLLVRADCITQYCKG